ncbi:prepilin-type cleavage/methylation domain-containing protein, partial [Coprobacillus cateniformis]|nr:prepilin-type cleavage/methylation domain-containing protein [Coprobacillus cateniformis]
KWFCIDGDSILSENKVKVYGFVKKIGTRSLILNYSTDNSKVAYLDFDNDGKLIGIEALEAELMNKKVKINNKEYSFDSIQQLNFVTDQSTELYFGKVV